MFKKENEMTLKKALKIFKTEFVGGMTTIVKFIVVMNAVSIPFFVVWMGIAALFGGEPLIPAVIFFGMNGVILIVGVLLTYAVAVFCIFEDAGYIGG
jgi:hypothetical protein